MKRMKMKATLILGALILVASSAFAQYDDPLAPRIGVKGGVNFSNLKVEDIGDNNTKVGLNLGLFAKMPVSEAFAVQPELLYSSKGSKVKYTNFVQGEGEYRFNLNYLELPVLAVITLGENFNIHAGPYIGYLTGVNIKQMDDDLSIDGVRELNEKDFNRFDYGLAGGVGVELGGFTVGARYNYGLKEVGKSNNLSGQLTDNSKNSVATLYIGYGF